MEGRTSVYLVREEMNKEKLRSRAGRRAVRFEERLMEGRDSRLARMCLEEIRERGQRGGEMSEWEKERWQFLEERGVEIVEWEGSEGRTG